jgi:maleate isomerase
MHPPGDSLHGLGMGVVVPYDFALDRELWRWTPDDVTLHLTRTPSLGMDVSLAMASLVGDEDVVARATTDLSSVSPGVVAYACTSGSFVRGTDGELGLVRAMTAAGAPKAVTTSGAIVEAASFLGVNRLAVATPYDAAVTDRLVEFLDEAGIEVTSSSHLGLASGIWHVPYETSADLVRRADHGSADAVFVSCTNLATYDIIGALERELGKPVITANQVTMWAALDRLGHSANGPGQWLVEQKRPARCG